MPTVCALLEPSLGGKLPTVEEADAEFSKWSHRLKPKRFALLGGEPLLNPSIVEHMNILLGGSNPGEEGLADRVVNLL